VKIILIALDDPFSEEEITDREDARQKKRGIALFAIPLFMLGGPKGIRTPVTDVRGQCPRPLDDGTSKFELWNDLFI
jgi:hypothetical protein